MKQTQINMEFMGENLSCSELLNAFACKYSELDRV